VRSGIVLFVRMVCVELAFAGQTASFQVVLLFLLTKPFSRPRDRDAPADDTTLMHLPPHSPFSVSLSKFLYAGPRLSAYLSPLPLTPPFPLFLRGLFPCARRPPVPPNRIPA